MMLASSRACALSASRASFLSLTDDLLRTPGSHAAGAVPKVFCSAASAVACPAVNPYATGVALISVEKFADQASSSLSLLGKKLAIISSILRVLLVASFQLPVH